MKVAGIVVEYNPLHKGHLYHLQKVRELTGCDLIVAVMSGNFVQRGDFAVCDKWLRAGKAVECGVDLVLELPFPFVVQSAAHFGAKAVDILAMAKVEQIVFGSETNNLEELQEIAHMSFNIDNFRENMAQGYSYPASYGFMADSYGPNDILAISYLRQLDNYPDIKPVSILRTGNYHAEAIDPEAPSAKAIRRALESGQDVSQLTPLASELKQYPAPKWEQFYPYLRAMLLTNSPERLAQHFLMDEGIENHLIKTAGECRDFAAFLNKATTRRYTASRIKRTLCHLLVNNLKEEMKALPPYDRIRPLAYSDKGREYLKQLRKDGVTVVSHFSQNIKPYRDLEYRAAVVYGMLMNEEDRYRVVRGEICGPYLDVKKADN
ncbi:MAG: nucleotidyltransferase family protein [Erysipelotrichaceae bacterium]|nr:nucleotidyltransferase family protein [Erysipelotrichaceae bacterium]